ncbi:MAG: cob(I)yrinic acid a,c-diamide adenosyltransferase [Bacteroidales bacterium]
MKIYTRTGDDGTTSLPGGRRVPKYHPRIVANGDLDELNSWIGLLRNLNETRDFLEFLGFIQTELMKCSADIASGSVGPSQVFTGTDTIQAIESTIDKLGAKLSPAGGFVIPGGNIPASYCHIARCVCRRAERSVLVLNQDEKVPEVINIFLNRLSDYLFILAGYVLLQSDTQ